MYINLAKQIKKQFIINQIYFNNFCIHYHKVFNTICGISLWILSSIFLILNAKDSKIDIVISVFVVDDVTPIKL